MLGLVDSPDVHANDLPRLPAGQLLVYLVSGGGGLIESVWPIEECRLTIGTLQGRWGLFTRLECVFITFSTHGET